MTWKEASPLWEGTPTVGEVVLGGGDPRLEGVGLGFGSSLPVLPGLEAMLRLTPSLCPHTPKPTHSSVC